MASRLYPNRTSQKDTRNSLKLKINCKNRIDSNPETKDWLELIGKFEHDSSNIKVYRGLLDKKNEIVAKIGKHTLQMEYAVAEKLDALKLPTIISYICIFTCLDDFSKMNSLTKSVCKEEGKSISIILMPYINGGRIEDFKWIRANFDVMKNTMKHVCLSLFYAKKSLGFVHRDLHLGNVLMKMSKRKTVSYDDFGELAVLGYLPIIMDFDRSIFVTADKLAYEDMFKFISLMSNGCNVKFDWKNIRELLTKLIKTEEYMDTAVSSILCKMIDDLEISYVSSEILGL